jgi:hypothetical protein
MRWRNNEGVAMNRKIRREIIARLLSIIVAMAPVTVFVFTAILTYQYLGWPEGAAIGLSMIGVLGSIASAVAVVHAWDDYGKESFIDKWINEPEEPSEEKQGKPLFG